MAIDETTILLRLPKKLKKDLDRMAKVKNITRSSLIRLGLTEYLSQVRLKQSWRKKSSQDDE